MAAGSANLSATFEVGQNQRNLNAEFWVSDFNDETTMSQGIDASTLQAIGVLT